MAIPFTLQYFTERERNNKFEWLAFIVSIILMFLHGVLFHWIPFYLRTKRDANVLNYKFYFNFLKHWNLFTRSFGIRIPFRKNKFYIQPSIFILLLIYGAINGAFCFVQTIDLDYEPRKYIIAKRIGRVAVGNLPFLMILIIKHDLFCAISGLQHDKLIFFHKWVGRVIWLLITIHMALSAEYWLNLGFPVMLTIPPQIFGFIAYGSLSMLTWASLKFMRRWAFDFFLVQHRVFSFIMLLLAFFHNSANKGAIILAVHAVVLDRVIGRIIGVVNKRRSPTKFVSEFEALDDSTILVTIPMRPTKMDPSKWFYSFTPKVGVWKAGQHVYLNVFKVKWFQYHPFTISSLSSSNEMKLVIRQQKGFTKKLMKKIQHLQQEQDVEIATNRVEMKVGINGPFGSVHQPLTTFDSVLFIGAGAGGSFILPVALDLLQTIKLRNAEEDYFNRPASPLISIVWVIRQAENTKWYDHIFRELRPFIEKGLVDVQINVTSEKNDVSSEISTTDLVEGKDVSAQKLGLEVGTSRDSFDGRIRYECGRPNIAEVIARESQLLHNSNFYFKSLAVVSCGPEPFANTIKDQCQVNRKIKGSPDIYCYSESF